MSDIVIYEDGTVALETTVENESVWLTQQQISELFGVQRPAITKHLSNIFKSGQLDEKVVCSILETTTFGSNSPDSNIFFKCFEIAGTFTSKQRTHLLLT
jgi:hypothetical protein